MVDIPADSSTSTYLSVGFSQFGSLETDGDKDWYRLFLSAGQEVRIDLTGIGTNPVEDTYLRILDSQGNVLYENDDVNTSAGNLNSSIAFRAPSYGTYFVEVGSYYSTGDKGDYKVEVSSYQFPPEYSFDQIADQLIRGFWDGNTQRFDVSAGGALTVNLTALTSPAQTLARAALQQWSEITGIQFTEVTLGGQITFDDTEEGAFSESTTIGGFITTSHVNVSEAWLADYGTGLNSYSFQTYIHEIGHALGLGHAGNYNGDAAYPYDALFRNDSWAASVMSYFSQEDNTTIADQGFTFNYTLTPMIADVLAMSLLYGTSTTTRTGDNVYIAPSGGAMCIFDSAGNDTIDASASATGAVIDLNPGTYSNLNGEVGNVSIALGVAIENAIGGSGNDTIYGNGLGNHLLGGAGSDNLHGAAGDDVISGGLGNNVLDGGVGNDTVDYSDLTFGVNANLSTGLATFIGTTGNDTLSSFDNLTGSQQSDTLTGSFGMNVLVGNGGNDVLAGLESSDVLNGGLGVDQLDGGADGDIYLIGSTTEHAASEFGDTGSSGTDEVRFAATGTAQTLTLFAADIGIERVVIGTGTGASAVTTGSLGHGIDARELTNAVTLVGNNGANILRATYYADTLQGGHGDDLLYGYEGNDTLDGGRGVDRLYGGAGNDTYVVTDATDYAYELAGEGTDTVQAAVSVNLRANIESLVLTGPYSITGRGNDLDNTITGNSGSNRMWGMGGNDTLIGNAGNDFLDGSEGSDTLIGGIGNDVYYVDTLSDTIVEAANEGYDTVRTTLDWTLGAGLDRIELLGSGDLDGTGNGLANILSGNAGANVLSGLDGNDRIFGKEG
ncbi:M10 family metallopeptidase C-terminal domain-containing protein, partial [Sphingomonas arenae]